MILRLCTKNLPKLLIQSTLLFLNTMSQKWEISNAYPKKVMLLSDLDSINGDSPFPNSLESMPKKLEWMLKNSFPCFGEIGSLTLNKEHSLLNNTEMMENHT